MKATSNRKKLPAKKSSPPTVGVEGEVNSFPVVAIGASAGGLEAMMELLKYLPANTGMAFIYVQHLSPDHKSLLTEILSKKTSMMVQEIDDMDKIKPNNVFVIPYNKGIEVTDGHIKLIPRSETGAAISIDILFSSLAEAQKERVIGIILSGSASDGTVGMKVIKQEGGLTFAQNDTAKFTSMPHSAIAAGVVDFILSPKEIALELTRLSKHPLIKTIGIKNGEEDLIENTNPDLKTILNLLHKATSVDFSAYKMNTIKRRIIRRMLLYKISSLKEYAKLLSQKKEEIDILYQDLLINVTSFFRDTDTHKFLKENLLPKLLKRKKTGESLRIWVPACATGEEAYSIAMMLLEIQGSLTNTTPVQIFATDLSEQVITKARIGIYTKQELETVSPKRIQRFFTKANGGFGVNKSVRDMCVFAQHNILQDPPFSRLDFISCCNLFIYLDNAAQKKAVTAFHYALNDDGFLMLGKSENISQAANLFKGFSEKYKIFSRKINSETRTLPVLSTRYAQQTLPEKNNLTTNKNSFKQNISVNRNVLDNAIDAVLVSDFMPASVVINYQMEIVQFRGITDLFLTHPKGKATFNILKMARPEITFELRNAISKVIKTKHRIRKSGIELKINSAVRIISFEIVALKIESDEPLLLILFTEQEQAEIYSQQTTVGKNNSLAKDRRIKKLEDELASAHADALAFAQGQEAFTEELQSANEEVVSSNEELQTVNEELETSKEEIESANEELTTTNEELQTRNDLLNEAHNYSEAVIATMHDPMIVLDKSLRVKSASKVFYEKFKVNEEETEGVLLYDLGNQQWNIPRLRELLENILPKNTHFYDFEITHTFPLIGEKIMLLNARRIVQKTNYEELILLAFADVTEVRKKALELQSKENEILLLRLNAEKNLRKIIEDSERRYNLMLMQSPFGFAVLKGKDMIVTMANDSLKQMWGKGKKIEGKTLIEILPEIKDQEFPALLHKVYTSGIPYKANEALARVKRKGKMEDVYFNFVYQPYREADDTISGVTIIAIEVTEQVQAKKIIEENEKQFRNLVEQAPVAMCVFRGDDYVFEVANEKQLQLLGKTKEQVINIPVFTAIPEAAGQGYEAVFEVVYKTGIPFIGNESPLTIIRNGKEETIYVNFIYEPLYDRNQKINGIFSVATDVTEQVMARKIIEASEKKFQAAILAVEGIIWTNNGLGEMEGEQPGWANLTGQSFEEYQGFGWSKAVHPKDTKPTVDAWNIAVANKSSFEFEHRVNTKQDGYKIFSVKAVPVFDNKDIIQQWIGVHTNISKQREIEKKIKENEKQKVYLLKLSDALRSLSNPLEIEGTATKIALDFMQADRCYYCTLKEGNAIVLRDAFRGDLTSLAAVYTVADFSLLIAAISAGRPFVVDDVNTSDIVEEGLKQMCRQVQVISMINIPVIKDGKAVGVFVLAQSKPRKWTEAEVQLSVETTERTWAAVERTKAVEALGKSEEKYRTLFTSIDQGFTLCELIRNKEGNGIDFYMLEVNPTYEQQTGISKEMVLGKKMLQVFPSLDKWIETYSAVVDNQRSVVFEYYFEDTDRWFAIKAYPVEKERFAVLFNNITERKKVEEIIIESEKKFKQLAELMPQKIWTADAQGNKTYFNQTFLDYTGLTYEEIINGGWIKINHPDDFEENEKRWQQSIATGNNFEIESRFLRKDGKFLWHLTLAVALKDEQGKVILWVGSKTEIEEQRKQKELLEDAVTNRTAELKQSNLDLVKINKELEAFTYVSSHDLQEPLRKIQTFAGRILEKDNQNLSINGKNYFRIIQNEAQRMKTLIQDLLAFSKLNIADRKFETTDLNVIIEEVKNEFSEAIVEKHAIIEVKEICDVHIIPFQFRQLMHNLISNALKFSNKKIPPHITIDSRNIKYSKLNVANLPPQKDYCHISITDNGIGFEKEFAEKIFEVFQKLHGKDEYNGTGIGLAIVKKIVDNHNGIINATSELNKGTTFNIYIPVKQKK